jgi:RimJ/RimL family protein N-acetyltransferase
VLNYPFGVLKVRHITARCDASNGIAIRNVTMIGFREEGRQRRVGRNGGDVIIYGLLPDECPFWSEPELDPERVAA